MLILPHKLLINFLKTWLQLNEPLFIRAFVDKNHPNSPTLPAKTFLIDSSQPSQFEALDALQSQGYGIHTPLNILTKEFVIDPSTCARGLFVDIDNLPDWQNRLSTLPVPPTYIVQHTVYNTAHTHAHLYWLFDTPIPLQTFDWPSFQKSIAAHFGCSRLDDVSHPKSLLRLPYTYHQKNNTPSLLQIVGGTRLSYPASDLLKKMDEKLSRSPHLSKNLKKTFPSSSTTKKTLTLSSSQQDQADIAFQLFLASQKPPAKDGAKQALYVMSCRAKERGITYEKSQNLLLSWIVSAGRYPTPLAIELKHTLLKTIRDAYTYGQNDFGAYALQHLACSQDIVDKLQKSKGNTIKPSLHNMQQILHLHPFFTDLFAFNEFTHNIELMKSTKDYYYRATTDKTLQDIDLVELKSFCSSTLRVEMSPSLISEAILTQAHKFAYHPIRQYLTNITWDGVPRIANWLADYAKAEVKSPADKKLLAWSGTSFLVAAVARIFKPGTKYDHMLVLQGAEGIGKSTVFNILASDDFYKEDTFNVRMNENKDYQEGLDDAWIIEMGEMTNMQRVDQEGLKLFISRRKAHYRKAYDRRGATYPRQFVLAATTNKTEYLVSTDGNRRFLPVTCTGTLDLDGLLRDRDQIWAEAVVKYKAKFSLALPPDLVEIAKRAAESRQVEDGWREAVLNFVKVTKSEKKPFTISDVYTHPAGLFGELKTMTKGHEMRLSNVLKSLGFERVRRRERGILKYLWIEKGSDWALPVRRQIT